MKMNNLIYAPALKPEFRCRVPLRDARQLFLVDGSVQGAGSPLAFRLEDGEQMDKMLQIIGVRMAAADELAVAAFLAGRIGFMDIPRLVERALGAVPPGACDSEEAVRAAVGAAERAFASASTTTSTK